MDVDVEAHGVGHLVDGGQAQQHPAVGDDRRAVVIGDERLVAGVDEPHVDDVFDLGDEFGLHLERDRRSFTSRFDEHRQRLGIVASRVGEPAEHLGIDRGGAHLWVVGVWRGACGGRGPDDEDGCPREATTSRDDVHVASVTRSVRVQDLGAPPVHRRRHRTDATHLAQLHRVEPSVAGPWPVRRRYRNPRTSRHQPSTSPST